MDSSSLPVSAARRVDEACHRFEVAWKTALASGAAPNLDEFLADATPEERPVLLRELLRVEVHYRRRQGEEPRRDDYLARFPTLAPALLTEVLGATPDGSATDGGAGASAASLARGPGAVD